jgi:hypothetical protein
MNRSKIEWLLMFRQRADDELCRLHEQHLTDAIRIECNQRLTDEIDGMRRDWLTLLRERPAVMRERDGVAVNTRRTLGKIAAGDPKYVRHFDPENYNDVCLNPRLVRYCIEEIRREHPDLWIECLPVAVLVCEDLYDYLKAAAVCV